MIKDILDANEGVLPSSREIAVLKENFPACFKADGSFDIERLCVMPTAIMQFNSRIKNNRLKKCVNILITAFVAFMVTARLISGVHWFSDIVGGMLLSCGLVMVYYSLQKV